jgi:hypothetical protein
MRQLKVVQFRDLVLLGRKQRALDIGSSSLQPEEEGCCTCAVKVEQMQLEGRRGSWPRPSWRGCLCTDQRLSLEASVER